MNGSSGSEKQLWAKVETWVDGERAAHSHLEEHLHLEGCETVAFLDSWIPLEEGSSGDSPTDPLDGNHLTLGGDERRVRVLLHKGGSDACESQDTVISPNTALTLLPDRTNTHQNLV